MPDGLIYEGSFVNNSFEKGVLKLPDGRIYEG
jgi:hypothetical protein